MFCRAFLCHASNDILFDYIGYVITAYIFADSHRYLIGRLNIELKDGDTSLPSI